MPDETNLEIEISYSPSNLELTTALAQFQVEAIERAGVDGGGGMTTVLLIITPIVLKQLVEMIRARNARDKFTIKTAGVVIESSDPEKVEKLLSMLLKAKKK